MITNANFKGNQQFKGFIQHHPCSTLNKIKDDVYYISICSVVFKIYGLRYKAVQKIMSLTKTIL